MYLHLGAETVVRTDSIIAVCDLDNASSSHITREALRAAEKAGFTLLGQAFPNKG